MATEMEEFKAWLIDYAGFSGISAKDVVSRVRRASEMVNMDAKMDTEDLLHKMSKNAGFKDLSVSVRSQIRRAVKLYKEFDKRK